MNEATRRQRVRELISYERPEEFPIKLTVVLDPSYQEVIDRLGILQGENKTAVIKSALDCYASQIGDAHLFPTSQGIPAPRSQ